VNKEAENGRIKKFGKHNKCKRNKEIKRKRKKETIFI